MATTQNSARTNIWQPGTLRCQVSMTDSLSSECITVCFFLSLKIFFSSRNWRRVRCCQLVVGCILFLLKNTICFLLSISVSRKKFRLPTRDGASTSNVNGSRMLVLVLGWAHYHDWGLLLLG